MEYVERFLRSEIKDLYGSKGRAIDYIELKDALLNIDVEVKIEDKIVVDFSGTHKQIEVPLNAVYGVTVAATTYSIKTVLNPELPMNYGFFKVLKIIAPEGTIVNPKKKPAPVSAGNVETSQRIVDVILKAFSDIIPDRVPVASHGSMNNVTIGGSDWAFYETIGVEWVPDRIRMCGRVHTNMTNTMNTLIEVIEREYPILILEYSLREDSGGPGRFRGGLGIRRIYKLLSPAVFSITAERIEICPWGLKGVLIVRAVNITY